MGKKPPKLTLVEPVTTAVAVPATLGKTGADLWLSIQTEYRIADSGGVETLLQICSAADRAAEYAAAIDRDGPMISTKHGPREHPLIKHELAARAFVVRGLQRLGLNVEAIKPPGRPGRAVIALTDPQLATVVAGARTLPVEKRDVLAYCALQVYQRPGAPYGRSE